MFERGFKAWCERLAEQYRRELGLNALDPLDPWKLAKFLEITIWSPVDVPNLDPAVLHHLMYKDADSWSAVTLCVDGKDLIILNSAHALTRQANDLMHEIAHLLCGHTAARVDVTEDGFLVLNTYDRKQEDEADWLAGALLLPRVALVAIVKNNLEVASAAQTYGISRALLEMRLNVTGTRVQQQRTMARRR